MNYKKWLAATAAAAVLTAGLLSGCGSGQQQATPSVKVNTFKVFTSSTPIQRQYTGTVEALQEVPVKAKVSGTVTEKYVSGVNG